MKDIMHPDRMHEWAAGAVRLSFIMAVHALNQSARLEKQAVELQRKLREKEKKDGTEKDAS